MNEPELTYERGRCTLVDPAGRRWELPADPRRLAGQLRSILGENGTRRVLVRLAESAGMAARVVFAGRAHLVRPGGHLTLCGRPSERMRADPDGLWLGVELEERCATCHALFVRSLRK